MHEWVYSPALLDSQLMFALTLLGSQLLLELKTGSNKLVRRKYAKLSYI